MKWHNERGRSLLVLEAVWSQSEAGLVPPERGQLCASLPSLRGYRQSMSLVYHCIGPISVSILI